MRIVDPHLRRARNIALGMLALCLLAFLGDWIAFEWYIARPIRNETARILSEADPEDRDVPPLLRKAMLAAYKDDATLATQVARVTNAQIFGSGRGRQIQWECHEVLENFAWRRMSERELLAVYAAASWNGEDHGMNRLSIRLYSKPLHELSEDEAAKIVALYRGPSYLLKRPDVWQARADQLRAAMDAPGARR